MSSDGDKLGECHRLSARVALQDGAVQRAEADLSRARALAKSPYDHAEVELLHARARRAGGDPDRASADLAVARARECGDEELAREAHVLCAELARDSGDTASARSHLATARALVDEVSGRLPEAIRQAYLARPALDSLHRVERALGDPADHDVEPASMAPASIPPRRSADLPDFVGEHATVKSLLASVARVAKTNATVLVQGESGTGKELVSELLHSQSARKGGPLVKVNCSALVETLLLSELFGHEKGAFTGANGRRRGRFERANGGTLFLDEIGDISPRTQVALLRVLEERRIERVGGSAPIEVDVRIVCATHRDLRAMVERGEFREDLYYRLSGITLEVPALRNRLSDLPALCDSILARVASERGELQKRVSRDALDLIARHRWPGNVRELENALRAASVLSDGEVIEARDLSEHVDALRKVAQHPQAQRVQVGASTGEARAELSASGGDEVTSVAYREIRQRSVSLADLKRNIERECIERALQDADGNITRAAALLGMKRPRLSQLVKQYGFLVNGVEDPS
jgi:DNA-binding NtrC family response regulator